MVKKTFSLEVADKKLNFNVGIGFISKCLEHFDTDLNGFVESISKKPYAIIPQMMVLSAEVYADLYDDESNVLEKKELLLWIDDNGGWLNEQMTEFLTMYNKAFVHDVDEQKKRQAKAQKMKN